MAVQKKPPLLLKNQESNEVCITIYVLYKTVDKIDIEEFSRQSGRSATIDSRIDLQKRIELDEENKRVCIVLISIWFKVQRSSEKGHKGEDAHTRAVVTKSE
jgi:hypothetical protein